MWWYYKCVNLIRVWIQGYKQVIFPHMKGALQKTSRAGGAPPRTDALIGPAAFGDVQKNGLCKTTRERRALSLLLALWLSWTWLEHLWNSAKLRPPTRAGPLDSHLENQPFMKSKTVPKPQNHGATNSTTAEQRAFPVTSRSRGFSEGARNRPRETRDKELNSCGKTKPTHPACFKPTESK